MRSRRGRPRLIFPIVGSVAWSNDFGAARYSGSHQGNDLMAPRRTVAVAAEAGKVKYWTSSSSAGCMLYLYGKSGTTYLYIHLNNDVTKGNDNRGKCVPGMAYAKGLKDGQWSRPGRRSASWATRATPTRRPAPPLRGAPERRRRGQPVPVPDEGRAADLRHRTGHDRDADGDGQRHPGRYRAADDEGREAQAFPAGAVLDKMRRPLKLGVAETVQVDLGNKVVGAKSAPKLLGHEVVVLTEPTAATLAAAAVRPGAYSAGRVVLANSGR